MFTEKDIENIGRFIKKKRLERGLSARQLAREVGISDAHVIYIENAKRRPAFDKMLTILAALGSDVEEMLGELGRENRRPFRRIPVVTWVKAGHWREVCDAFEPGDADEWISSDVHGPNVFALQVAGDSMEPEFKDGEIIIVNPHVEAQPGDFVVVKNPDGEATFKQIKRYGSRWVLHPLNPRYPDQEVHRRDVRIIGRVVKKEKRY
jgi:SOS-response transcriptional repressor LexA